MSPDPLGDLVQLPDPAPATGPAAGPAAGGGPMPTATRALIRTAEGDTPYVRLGKGPDLLLLRAAPPGRAHELADLGELALAEERSPPLWWTPVWRPLSPASFGGGRAMWEPSVSWEKAICPCKLGRKGESVSHGQLRTGTHHHNPNHGIGHSRGTLFVACRHEEE